MNPPESIKTLDQKRAAHAWQVAQEACRLEEKKKKEFGTQVKKLPTRIMAAGLGQALAFLEAKDYARPLREVLAEWMNQRRPVAAGQETRLMVRVIQGDSAFMQYATAECLAYLTWLVRFADALGLTDKTEG